MVSAGCNATGNAEGTGNAGSACACWRVLGAASAFCSDSTSLALLATGSSAGVLGFWFFLVEVACSGLAISVRASVAFVAVVPWSSVFLPGAGVLLGDIAGAGIFF